ncbi:MAG TPA: 3-deoxy-manno-octulosonate cytidylyltransferase [Bacteroidales bacterium]|nr:3-deoxy-manno-octulosonate cytidylyltransferase [Bacteroidales bacterium]
MKIAGIIPARWASTRFPGKPLAVINGKSMIRRVCEQAMQCSGLDSVMVATDDKRIADEVMRFGGKAIMTGQHHPSGTDRCLEALEKCGESYDAVINIQGDEPYVNPEHIQLLVNTISKPGSQLATLACRLDNSSDLFDPNVVKVAIAQNGNALYFSRQPIPYLRGIPQQQWHLQQNYYRHIGMYAYASHVLRAIALLGVSPLEKAESLEQLRWLENGYTIAVAITEGAAMGVDTPEDVHKLSNLFENMP